MNGDDAVLLGRAELEQAYQECKLPEAPLVTAALDNLLVRVRLKHN